MTAPDHGTATEVARFYTRARKFPRMIGRLPEGTRIWGGPYTLTQLALAAVAAAAAAFARPVWSTGSIITDLCIIAGLGAGAAVAARSLPVGHLNPLVLAMAALGTAFAPRGGVLRGRAVRVVKPVRWRSR